MGNYIKINDNNGVTIVYSHLDSINVSKDEVLSKNQNLGTAGNTGNTYLECCGIRAFKNGEKIDIIDQINIESYDEIIYKDRIEASDLNLFP